MHWVVQVHLVTNKVRKLFDVFSELCSILDCRKIRSVYKDIVEYIIFCGLMVLLIGRGYAHKNVFCTSKFTY